MGDVALLTGASAGIGAAVADILAGQGYSIVLVSRDPDAAAARLRERHGARTVSVAADIADPETPARLLAACEPLGPPSALLLNHGGPPVKPFEEVSDEEWSRFFATMVLGPLRLLRTALPTMRAAGGGRVVAISSFTVKSPLGGVVLSNSLRAGLVNALKTVASEAGPDNVLVNAVGPGYTATERLINFNRAFADRAGVPLAQVDQETLARIPLGRYGDPHEVAELVAFLLSERNGYITGQHLLADGGYVTAT